MSSGCSPVSYVSVEGRVIGSSSCCIGSSSNSRSRSCTVVLCSGCSGCGHYKAVEASAAAVQPGRRKRPPRTPLPEYPPPTQETDIYPVRTFDPSHSPHLHLVRSTPSTEEAGHTARAAATGVENGMPLSRGRPRGVLYPPGQDDGAASRGRRSGVSTTAHRRRPAVTFHPRDMPARALSERPFLVPVAPSARSLGRAGPFGRHRQRRRRLPRG
jgi:hypothetical protein